ncbi:hypothetical protein Tco_0049549 [Tanacetum coccineum]
MSSVLGSSVSFVTLGSFSTTGGKIGGPSYEAPLRMVIALPSFLGFGMVLLGNELELEAWYGYVKNHKKIVKNRQARTRERKSVQKPEAKARKSQSSVNYGSTEVNSLEDKSFV